MASLPKRVPNFQLVHSIFIFVFVIILPFVSSSDSAVARASPATQTVAKQSEAIALLMWKASLDNQSQSLLSSWNETSHCTWVGIGCNDAGKVTNVNLDSIGLRGTLFSLNFSLLPHLVKLDLSNNLIYGTIPSQISGLSRLASLSVSINHLSGGIPSEVAMLRSLIELDLSMNNLTGSIPSSIGILRNLTTLYLYKNSLSGSIPQEVGMLRSLTVLLLYTNNLTGSIPPSIGNLRNLTMLYLYKNSLSGSIPQEVGMLRSLTALALSTNNLTGSIPTSIGNLRNLTKLFLYENSLSGSIPQEVGMLRSLTLLILYTNNLTGSIPPSIGNLRNLTTLYLDKNSLSGSIPQEVGMLRSLTDLALSTNNLTGSIPASIGNLRNLTTLYLYENSLSGSIPQELGMLRSLTDLALSTNNLTGSIPASIGNLRNLTTLYLYENSLSGSIPQEVGMLRSLTSLALYKNNLMGSIPASIGNLRNLTTLYLYETSLSGSIPQEVGMLRSLTALSLPRNNLTGSIPSSIGNLRNLTMLYLDRNSLSGSIPQEVGMLRSLTALSLQMNNLTGSIPASIGNLRNLTTLFLYENSLSGSIPQEVGMLRSLTDLDLSTNNLTGSIPASIWDLPNLTKLILRENSLFHRNRTGDNKINPNRATNRALCEIWSFNGKLVHENIIRATEDFNDKHCIGVGGYGIVYRAELPSGQVVAIKKFHGSQDGELTNLRSLTSTLEYAAPELAYTMEVNEKLDVYSFGVLTLEVVMGRHPGDIISSLSSSTFDSSPPSSYGIFVKNVLDPTAKESSGGSSGSCCQASTCVNAPQPAVPTNYAPSFCTQLYRNRVFYCASELTVIVVRFGNIILHGVQRGGNLETVCDDKIEQTSTLDFYILNEETASDWYDTFLSFRLSRLPRGVETLTLLVLSDKTSIIEVIEAVEEKKLIGIAFYALRRCSHISALHIVSAGDPNRRKSFQFEYKFSSAKNHQLFCCEGEEKNLQKVICSKLTEMEENHLIMGLHFVNPNAELGEGEFETVVYVRDEFYWEQVKLYAKGEELGD
ncbi:hypothetical protein RHGRI_003336 [Rhododendron griersonianum]|uniref:Leucine-rich repeat receptor-like protein kinase n=1 Tax=Rhododendron griersonianum TaxID=479676 RepID=A0AAV6L7A4_9ERIC|nr:hypothetical protein RHGRI_003336 [Rhododendron griersonianum]